MGRKFRQELAKCAKGRVLPMNAGREEAVDKMVSLQNRSDLDYETAIHDTAVNHLTTSVTKAKFEFSRNNQAPNLKKQCAEDLEAQLVDAIRSATHKDDVYPKVTKNDMSLVERMRELSDTHYIEEVEDGQGKKYVIVPLDEEEEQDVDDEPLVEETVDFGGEVEEDIGKQDHGGDGQEEAEEDHFENIEKSEIELPEKDVELELEVDASKQQQEDKEAANGVEDVMDIEATPEEIGDARRTPSNEDETINAREPVLEDAVPDSRNDDQDDGECWVDWCSVSSVVTQQEEKQTADISPVVEEQKQETPETEKETVKQSSSRSSSARRGKKGRSSKKGKGKGKKSKDKDGVPEIKLFEDARKEAEKSQEVVVEEKPIVEVPPPPPPEPVPPDFLYDNAQKAAELRTKEWIMSSKTFQTPELI